MDVAQNYRKHAISTQEPGRLLVMLYDGALRFLDIAEEKLEAGDDKAKWVYIGKAQDIVAELNNSLNMEAGGELAHNLRALYHYIHRELSVANAERDVQKIRECREILEELMDGWKQIVEKRDTAGSGAPLNQVASQQA